MDTINREWLNERKARPGETARAEATFGPDMAVTRANYERARAMGINLLWLGVRMTTPAQIGEFVEFTVAQRRAALIELATGLRGSPPLNPLDVSSAVQNAAEAEVEWGEGGGIAARSRMIAFGDLARDLELSKPTWAEAEESALAAQRAISYAGLDQEAAKREQIEWLASRLIKDW